MSSQSNGESRADYENRNYSQVAAMPSGPTKMRSRVSAFGLPLSRDVELCREYPIDSKNEFGPLENSFCVYKFIVQIEVPSVEFTQPDGQEKIVFRYPTNLAANIVKEVKLVYNGSSSLMLGDTHTINIHEHFFRGDHLNPMRQKQLGICPQMNTYSQRKDSSTLLVELPILSSPDQPFPIQYTTHGHETFVKASLRKDLLELIQLAKVEEDESLTLIPSEQYHQYLPRLLIDGHPWYGGHPEITKISLLVNHVYITSSELQFYKNEMKKRRDMDKGGLVYNMKYFVRIQTDGLSCDGENNLLIPLECNQLAQGIFVMMQSNVMPQLHDYSNYTDPNGESPVHSISLFYDQEEVGGPYSSTILTQFSGARQQPYQNGYHAIGMGVGLYDVGAIEHGNFYKHLNAKLKVKLSPRDGRNYQSFVYLMCAGSFVVQMDTDDVARLTFTSPRINY